MQELAASAAALARQLLDRPDLADRWKHVQGVGRRAEALAATADTSDRKLLTAVAWLHDIGYAPELADTGCRAAP